MAVEVDLSSYLYERDGVRPYGRGHWAFEFPNGDEMWVQGNRKTNKPEHKWNSAKVDYDTWQPLTYTKARDYAKKIAKEMGVSRIVVLS